MKKQMTKREKILLAFLCVILIGLAYYKLFYEPLKDQIASVQAQTESEQTMIDQNMLVAAQIKKMEKTIEEVKESGEYRDIPTFDNNTLLMKELNVILSRAKSYTLGFGAVTTKDSIAARPATLSFTAENYTQARAILDKIDKSDNVNQIGDLSINMSTTNSSGENVVNVYCTITYYELVA